MTQGKDRLLLVAGLLLSCGCGGQTRAHAQLGGAAPRSITARDFADTFGVNVHFGENGYRDAQAVADALRLIGFSRVRGSCVSASDVAAWKALAAKTRPSFPAGLKADVLIGGYLNAPGVTLASQEALVSQLGGLVESVEGPNEINNYSVDNGTHGPSDRADRTKSFAANSQAWAKALYLWRKSTPALSEARLFGPTIAGGDPKDYAALPDISPFVDAGGVHFYAGNGRQPSGFGGGNFAALYGWCRASATPGKSLALTEWGQTTAGRPGQGGCDEATQAKYVLNQMFDAVSVGADRAYLYQLMDDTPDGDPTGAGGSEAHFGLFDSKWRPKPAARALANVKALLADTPARVTPPVPAYRVSGVTDAGAAGDCLSVSTSGGSTFLVVWNEPQVWDPKTNSAVTPPADAVTVDFGGDYAYTVYDPLVGVSAVAAGRGAGVKVRLLGSPVFVKITPAKALQ